MATELDTLVVTLRADTERFRGEIAEVQSALEDLEAMAAEPRETLAETAREAVDTGEAISRATRETFEGLETVLRRFAETGRVSFSELREVALSTLNEIARETLNLPLPGQNGGSGGLASALLGGAASLLGRASGGPVTPDQPVVVGEQGAEVFVPRTAGDVVPNRPGASSGTERPVSITVNVNASMEEDAARRSGTQVALAVRRALKRAERFA